MIEAIMVLSGSSAGNTVANARTSEENVKRGLLSLWRSGLGECTPSAGTTTVVRPKVSLACEQAPLTGSEEQCVDQRIGSYSPSWGSP